MNYGCGCTPKGGFTSYYYYYYGPTCAILDSNDLVAENTQTYCCQQDNSLSPGVPIYFSCFAKGAGDTVLINGVQQGTGITHRLGSVINQHLLDINIDTSYPSSGAGTMSGFWAIVLDRQPNGTVASFSDIFDMHFATIRGQGDGAGNAFTRYDTGDRYQVLIQERWATGSMPYQYWNTIDLHSITSKFNASSSCGIPITGALLLCWGSTVAGWAPFNYNLRLHYTDQ